MSKTIKEMRPSGHNLLLAGLGRQDPWCTETVAGQPEQ